MKIMGKCFSFHSAVIIFWVFLFITIQLCCANSDASSATHQAFPENEEGWPENGNLGNTGSLNHVEKEKPFNKKHLQPKPVIFKKPFIKVPPGIADIQRVSPKPSISISEDKHLQPKPAIFKKPFIKVPPGIADIQRVSPKPSITISEEKHLHMVKRPGFLLIPLFRNLFPIPEFKRPSLKPIPCLKNLKFLHFPRFRTPILRPIPIVQRPIPGYERPVSEPLPAARTPIPVFEKPISEPTPVVEKPIPEDQKPVSKPIPAARKPIPESKNPIPVPIPEFEKPISQQIPTIEKPVPEDEKPISEPIPATWKPMPEDEKHIPGPIASIKRSNLENEKRIPISKKDLFLPQWAPTMDPESLKLKEYLFKKRIHTIPFLPKVKKHVPAHKPIPPP